MVTPVAWSFMPKATAWLPPAVDDGPGRADERVVVVGVDGAVDGIGPRRQVVGRATLRVLGDGVLDRRGPRRQGDRPGRRRRGATEQARPADGRGRRQAAAPIAARPIRRAVSRV